MGRPGRICQESLKMTPDSQTQALNSLARSTTDVHHNSYIKHPVRNPELEILDSPFSASCWSPKIWLLHSSSALPCATLNPKPKTLNPKPKTVTLSPKPATPPELRINPDPNYSSEPSRLQPGVPGFLFTLCVCVGNPHIDFFGV